MLAVCGPAVAALEAAFVRMWARAGRPLPEDETTAAPEECGPSAVRVVEGFPGQSRIYRAVQLLAAAVTERLWITDAYLVAPPPLYAAFVDAARSGVDVRLLLPGTTDIPIVRTFTRGGYRELLHAGARIFEYRGPMVHAKTLVGDHEWARVGSSNLNFSSLLGNYELDLVAEHDGLTATLAKQFLHDMAQSREIVLVARRRLPLPPRLIAAAAVQDPSPQHKRSLRERRAVAVVALMQVAGGAAGRAMLPDFPPPPQPPTGAARMGSSEEDKGLVAKALAGERDAFGVLVERYAAQARRVARAVLGDPDDADDAAQDGFLSALVKLAQYDTRRPFGPWLMRIVANAATDRRRRRNVRQAEPLDPALVGGGPRPDAAAIRSERGARVRTALGQLPERGSQPRTQLAPDCRRELS